MYSRHLVCVVLFVAGQLMAARAITIECHPNKTISITVLATDTDYHNKTIRPVNEDCVGEYGPVSSTGGTYVILFCNVNNTFERDTEYQFLFQTSSVLWAATDPTLSTVCQSYTGPDLEISFNASFSFGGPTTFGAGDSITDLVRPTLSLAIQRESTDVSVATIGDPLTIRVSVDSDYSSYFSIIIKEVNLISGSNVLSVLDSQTYCVNTAGINLGFVNQNDTSIGQQNNVVEIGLPAFIMTDPSRDITLTGSDIIFNVRVGVCTTGGEECNPQNCAEPTNSTRRRRDTRAVASNEVDLSETLKIFPLEEAENEFLSTIADQIRTPIALESQRVCVDRTVSITVIAVVGGLLVLGCASFIYLTIRSRSTREKREEK